MKIPKRIEHCPIEEALVEIRFSPSIPSSAVFGVVYSVLGDANMKVEELPILQLPELLRNRDPKLQFQPLYRFKGGEYLIQLGPRVLSVHSKSEYPGWEDFSVAFIQIFQKVNQANFIKSVSRCGLRYINFFDENIFDNINVRLIHGDKSLVTSEGTQIRTKLIEADYKSTLNIANDATRKKDNKKVSVIDIDTSFTNTHRDFFKHASGIFNKAHEIEKKLFFGLFKKKYLAGLEPTY